MKNEKISFSSNVIKIISHGSLSNCTNFVYKAGHNILEL